ncbi:hypothetical protein ACFP7A_01250 [Sporolactobacillus kofuensis]|uniref:Uncharacterized protein n=1 Tax=Sporolactobacillus kofuensis TaxID=269672 RepID=A0ABW1WAE3_9BACL|nr:hypothetical protein [Sporolactobacillus kofuensis]MCO7177024.1 hypothetical protein [Sporolactobacillus kofuensis]
MTKNELIEVFKRAKKQRFDYVGVQIHMDGYPENELIVNKQENFDSKLNYYLATYDDELNHKYAKGIYIADAKPAHFLAEFAGLF